MIGHKQVPSREGGVEVVVGELSRRMVERGHEVVLLSRRGQPARQVEDASGEAGSHDGLKGDPGRPYRWKGVEVVPVPTIRAKGLAALSSSICGTLRAIAMRPDVVHYHAEGPCVPLLLAHLAGIKTVATIHGLDWQRSKWGRAASLYIRLGERIAATFADEVIVLSRNMQRYFMDAYGRQTRYIPNGAERKEHLPAREIYARWGLTAGSYLLFLGRIVPEKGVHYLVDAFRELDTDKKLVIAGGDTDSEDYAASIRERVAGDDRIVMTGFVDGEALAELYSNAYLYVLPSDVEGMPLTLLEAMSYGCVCVTSDIPECDEVLKDRGAVFARGSVEELRLTLERLLKDGSQDERAALERSAAEHVLATYDWDAVVDQTLGVYRHARDGGATDGAHSHAGRYRSIGL